MIAEDITDKELVAQLQKGCVASFEELLERYTEKVHNLALRITRAPEDAEEVLQDVFITVYNKIDKFEGKSAFSSWLYRITVNTAFMKLRKRKKHTAVSLDDVNPGSREVFDNRSNGGHGFECLTSRHELREALEEAISSLPDDYRAIFLLRDVDGLSNQDVGKVLELSVPAVKSRLHRSRLMLRKKLQRIYRDYTNEDEIHYGFHPAYSGQSAQA